MNKFQKLTDEAFKLEMDDVISEYERRKIEDDNTDEVCYEHIGVDRELALEIAENPFKIDGIATGYPKLDKYLCGLSKGEMTAIAADTSVGKTLFVVNLIRKAYEAGGKFTTLYFSLDTATVRTKSRFYKMTVCPEDYPIFFYKNTRGIDFSKIKRTMLKIKEEKGLDLVVIDMLGSICRSVDKQTGETSSAVLKFRELALDLDIHIILLTHISMAAAKRRDLVPHYSDIKDSSSVYQDADMVIMLGRDALGSDTMTRDNMIISVQKNRNKGQNGSMTMSINWRTLQMEEN